MTVLACPTAGSDSLSSASWILHRGSRTEDMVVRTPPKLPNENLYDFKIRNCVSNSGEVFSGGGGVGIEDSLDVSVHLLKSFQKQYFILFSFFLKMIYCFGVHFDLLLKVYSTSVNPAAEAAAQKALSGLRVHQLPAIPISAAASSRDRPEDIFGPRF